MKTAGQVILAILLVGALSLYARSILAKVTTTEPLIPNATTSLEASPYMATGYVEQKGMVILDTAHGYPPVPFLEYTTNTGTAMTKQLVFANSRACAVYAGDIPCVATDEAKAYPQIPTGVPVLVKGEVKDDRILVYQIEPL
jgi:hypothetical protein